MSGFSERLRSLREQCDYTQEDVANIIHVNKQTISQYELGKRQPDFEKLERLCDVFNVSSDYLLGKSNVTARLLNTEELESINRNNTKQIPVYGNIAAGVPIEAITNITNFVDIPKNWKGEYGALLVKGNSMEPTILNGDIVIFRKQETADSGDIVTAVIDDCDVTVKKLIKRNSSVTLLPFNPDHDPLFFQGRKELNRLRILGIVVENRHRF